MKHWICLILALLLLTGCGGPDTATAETQVPTVSVAAPGEESPMGPRKIFNWNGCRYAFLENGAEYTIRDELLGEPLGTLIWDIPADPEVYGQADLAATFALGGQIRPVCFYDPAFRVAVELEGRRYLAENVDTLEGEPDYMAYYETAGFDLVSLEIRDHMGREVLSVVEDPEPLLESVFASRPVALSDGDYEAIGRAQTEGKSFLLVLNLRDTTRYTLYLIPELRISMIGDNRLMLPEDFYDRFGSLFAELTQPPLPMN